MPIVTTKTPNISKKKLQDEQKTPTDPTLINEIETKIEQLQILLTELNVDSQTKEYLISDINDLKTKSRDLHRDFNKV